MLPPLRHLVAGLALAAATPIPFLIQVYICSRLRSFEGISFASLIMGNLCMSTQIVNAVVLKWKQLQYCASAGYIACQPSIRICDPKVKPALSDRPKNVEPTAR